jgi:hypothetical protein
MVPVPTHTAAATAITPVSRVMNVSPGPLVVSDFAGMYQLPLSRRIYSLEPAGDDGVYVYALDETGKHAVGSGSVRGSTLTAEVQILLSDGSKQRNRYARYTLRWTEASRLSGRFVGESSIEHGPVIWEKISEQEAQRLAPTIPAATRVHGTEPDGAE